MSEPIHSIPWQAWALVGFLAFVVLTFRHELAQEQKIGRLEGVRPKLTVSAHTYRLNYMYLEVRNDGGKADIYAQIEVVRGQKTTEAMGALPLLYKGYWHQAAGPVSELATGHTDRLMLARFVFASMTMHYKFFYFDGDSNTLKSYVSDSWGNVIPQLEHLIAHPEIHLRVTISGSPSPESGPIVKVFRFKDGAWIEDIT